MISYNELPTTEKLILEVLAARWRLGEDGWTFETNLRKQLNHLEGYGYIEWKRGVTYGSALVWLTDAGKDVLLSDAYTLGRSYVRPKTTL